MLAFWVVKVYNAAVKNFHSEEWKMETFKIKAILAAVRHGSLSKAAEEFSYTPSAFSHMLGGFEKELGVKLFERTSTGVILSEAGKALYPRFREMAACDEEIWQQVAGIKGSAVCQLRIGTYSSISRNYLPAILKKIRKEYPHIKLSVSVVDNVGGMLEENRVDMVFANSEALKDSDWIPLDRDPYYVLAPLGMLKKKTVITVEELYAYPFLYTEDFDLSRYFDMGRFKELIRFKSEDDLSIFNMVKEGMGLTVVPYLVLKGAVSGLDVVPLEPEMSRTLAFAYHPRRIEALGLTDFVNRMEKLK